MYKGRNIYLDGNPAHYYPCVRWPEHHKARPNGSVYIHQDVALDKYGELPNGMHVHHIDGDVWNWSEDNLELVTPEEHGRLHNERNIVERRCGYCDSVLELTGTRRINKENVYCSNQCRAKGTEVIDWPSVDKLVDMANEHGYSKLGRIIGVSDNAIRKRIRNHQ